MTGKKDFSTGRDLRCPIPKDEKGHLRDGVICLELLSQGLKEAGVQTYHGHQPQCPLYTMFSLTHALSLLMHAYYSWQ